MSKYIFTFTTGRTGTGFLSRAFGSDSYKKDKIHVNNNCIVAHEPWSDLSSVVNDIKINGHNKAMHELINSYLESKLNMYKKHYDVDRMFVTDHRIGRYFAWAINDSKVIYINKPHEDIVKSFLIRICAREDKDIFTNKLWKYSFYHPQDIFINDLPTISRWETLSLGERINWYIEETDRQYLKFKNINTGCHKFEIEFDKLFLQHDSNNDIYDLAKFLSLKLDEDIITERINK